jgi:hypothetical protein
VTGGARRWLRYTAIAGDAVFALWVLRNGLEQGFRGTPAEVASFYGLIALLALNAALLIRA